MCGIVGKTGFAPSNEALNGLKSIRHRGPDETGVAKTSHGYLGISRLAIVDLTPDVQPVKSEDGCIVAVMNGEIYNHVELARIYASGTC